MKSTAQQLSITNIRHIVALDREYGYLVENGKDASEQREELTRFVESGEATITSFGFIASLPRHRGAHECKAHWNQLPHECKCDCTEEQKRELIAKNGTIQPA